MSSTPDDDRMDVGSLGSLSVLGSGGQGIVHVVAGQRINNSWPAVFKEYKPEVLRQLDQDALAGMVRFLMGMSFKDGNRVFERAAWPWRLVVSSGSVTGFLMRRVPEEYHVRLNGPAGPVEQLAQVQHLLNGENFLAARGIVFDDRLRLEFLRDVAETLVMFHSLDIVVGDLSPRNLLFSSRAMPRCFFIDCDAMRLGSVSALAQAETPEWMLPDGEELATAAADVFKFSLLAVRLFAGDQFSRDTAALAAVSPVLAVLAERGLSEDPAVRVSAADWMQPLLDCIAATPSTPTQVITAVPSPPPAPAPAPTPPPLQQLPNPASKPRSRAVWWIVAAVVAVLFLAVVGPQIFHSSTPSSSGNNEPAAGFGSTDTANPDNGTTVSGETYSNVTPDPGTTDGAFDPDSTGPSEQPSASTAPSASDPASPTAVVEAYFAAINQQDYQTAWDLGGKNFGAKYSTFAAGFSTTAEDVIKIVSASGDTVMVKLTAHHTDGSIIHYAGPFTVRDGVIVSASMRRG